MRELKTYVVETINVFYALIVAEVNDGGPYQASYLGVPRIAGSSEIDDTKSITGNIDGEIKNPHFDELLVTCYQELADRGGQIISVEDISDDDILTMSIRLSTPEIALKASSIP